MLRQYISIFASSDPVDALHYYCVIHQTEQIDISKGKYSLKEQNIKDLILETREFDILLGDGNTKVGQVEELLGKEKAFSIAELAALECESNGRYEDAIRLFDLTKVKN
jgi:hypothetical protein